MFNISNNGIITMTRGDTASFPVFINTGNVWLPLRYTLHPFDKLYFSVMEHGQSFEEGVLRKVITAEDVQQHGYVTRDGDVLMRLNHSDTVNLLPGNYTYEIKLISFPIGDSSGVAEPVVSTVSPKRKFILLD